VANKQISQLTIASTPLAGTEVLPIVQSGATVKVSAANITAGRNVNVRTILATVADGSYPIGVSGTTKGVRVLTDANATSIQGVDSTLSGSYQPLAFGGLELRLQSNGTTDRWWLDSGGNLVQKTAAKGVNFTANTPAAGMTSQLLNWYEDGTWTPNQGSGLTVVGAFSSTGKYTRIGRQVTVSGTVTGATSVAVTAAGIVTTNLPFTVVTAGHGDATNAAVNASAPVICTTTNVTSAGAIAATGTITFSATYFV
jgi:hypothetical protein